MTNFTSHSDEATEYTSTVTIDSSIHPRVRFTIRRMSFTRRCELLRQIREIAGKAEFLQAGEDFGERVEAGLLSCEVEKLYLRWGLAKIEGLTIDGAAATVETLIESGPEPFAKEIVGAIQRECGLTEDERKN